MPFKLTLKEITALLKEQKILVSEPVVETESVYCGIETDSRKINSGDIFICLKGYETDGHLYAPKAVENGAALLISEKETGAAAAEIIVTDSRMAAAYLSKLFYAVDDHRMKLVGVTGTNGKTTTAWLGYQLAGRLGRKAGFIGTIGYYIENKHYPTRLTTPDVLEMSRILAQMQAAGIEIVFLEASSHALAMDRLAGYRFSAALFLNLSQDHLDFHTSFADYFACKSRLFKLMLPGGISLINTADIYGERLWEQVSEPKYSIGSQDSDIVFNINKLTSNTSIFTLTINNENFTVKSGLTGDFNVQNLSFALASIMLLYPEIEPADIMAESPALQAVPGRLESVDNPEQKKILIDYAHTPDAISRVCRTIADLSKGRLITLLGAGGNRDKTKRPLMLAAALEYSDLVIVTTDNPRDEDPVAIIKDIMANADPACAVWLKEDRKSAIMDALYISGGQDTILITGKGHETYQEIKGKKFPFDDREIIREYYKKPAATEYQLHFDRIAIEFACNGQITTNSNCQVHNICTDTRKLTDQSLFIPLKGDNFDGHDYLEQALQMPDNLALCSREYTLRHPQLIKVDDPLPGYGRIARMYRQLFSARLIAITGSTGKTSVKEYLYNLISEHGSTIKTHSNENNYIGVPKTLLKLNGETEYGIVELGTNHFGEIKWLTQIVQPDVAVITNIGASHLEFLGDEAGVFQEKKAIFEENDCLRIFPGDDEKFNGMKGKDFGYKAEREYRIHGVYRTSNGYSFKINEQKYQIAAEGEFQITNASIAIIIALNLGIDPDEIRTGISKTLNLPLRMEIIEDKDQYIIADCYNANPQSMKAAVKHWQQILPAKPHVAILGSMLELGDNSRALHTDIGYLLTGHAGDLLISVGKDAEYYGFKHHFASIELLLNSLIIRQIPADAVILLKGSHGIHLEKLLQKYDPSGIFGSKRI
ncbi:MAG: UDP-N-acetylmuramoyl-L-alanyl-D-glutamate--2,6-diaminopimelate ligase [Candidatus Cloacimonetes bacterium]|nr:UDP-N-acetylmuramoyl-L-alanyl-D-glutamate--2,6-diaminopimelate ligase [Candidatus Cloacimonadota bacterium]